MFNFGKFRLVTEHYGYRCEIIGLKRLYVVYDIVDGKPDRAISGFAKWSWARNECRYLEKLNERRFKK